MLTIKKGLKVGKHNALSGNAACGRRGGEEREREREREKFIDNQIDD